MNDPKVQKVQIVIVVAKGAPIPLYTVACSVPATVSFADESGQIIAETEAQDITAMAAAGMASRC